MNISVILSFVFLGFASIAGFGQIKPHRLYLCHDTTADNYCYLNSKGDTIIPAGKYLDSYTKHFDKMAIVLTQDSGWVGIDRNENILFKIFFFDNGPDYPSNGLLRIIKNGRIGYADLGGKIVIEPQYDGAFSFVHGKARVGLGCKIQSDGEHSSWVGGQWFLIDKKGKILKKT